MTEPAPLLKVDSKCLAYHGPLLYEAKVLRVHTGDRPYVETKEGQVPLEKSDLPERMRESTAYFLHYNGWKKRWDEWVDPARVLALNAENLSIQRDLRREASEAAQAEKRASSRDSAGSGGGRGPSSKRVIAGASDSTASSQEPPKKRPKGDATFETEEDFLKRPEVHMAIPASLKKVVVDDWESVTKNQKLSVLPALHSVETILDDYRLYLATELEAMRKGSLPATTNPLVDHELVEETLAGLKLYFNRSIGVMLLYRFERQQYAKEVKQLRAEAKQQGVLPEPECSSVYGGEHLLRLLVSMPGLVAQTSMDRPAVSLLTLHLEAFMRFLETKKQTYFDLLVNYEHASPAYIALSKAT